MLADIQDGTEEMHVFQMAGTRQGWGFVGHELADSSENAFLVATAHWNVEHRVFAVKQLFRNGDSIVTVQCLFRRKFNVEHLNASSHRSIVFLSGIATRHSTLNF